MTVCIYRYIYTTTLYYWPNTTDMPHLKIKILNSFQKTSVLTIRLFLSGKNRW